MGKKAQEHRKWSSDRQKRTTLLFKTHGPGENTLDRAPPVSDNKRHSRVFARKTRS